MKKTLIILSVLLLLIANLSYSAGKRGGLVLAFDDGYPCWIKTVAPLLQQVGGVATVFVNNQRVHSGYLSFEDLLTLQNKYGWEINTHTYHHFNSVRYVEKYGLDKWIKDEVEASVSEFESKGIKKIRSLVFPFNAFNDITAGYVAKRFDSFRRYSPLPLTKKLNPDKSYPGTTIDLGYFVPLRQLKMWVNFSRMQNKLLFVYSHQVFSEDHYIRGTIKEVGPDYIIAKESFTPLKDSALCMVPTLKTRIQDTDIKVLGFENGNKIKVLSNNLPKLTKPGENFIVGPCYGIPYKEFKEFIEYTAKKIPFYTLSQALEILKSNN